jgi:hypothetical protein
MTAVIYREDYDLTEQEIRARRAFSGMAAPGCAGMLILDNED